MVQESLLGRQETRCAKIKSSNQIHQDTCLTNILKLQSTLQKLILEQKNVSCLTFKGCLMVRDEGHPQSVSWSTKVKQGLRFVSMDRS